MNSENRYRVVATIIMAVATFLALTTDTAAQDSFGPWEADVAVGDGALPGAQAWEKHGCGGTVAGDRGVYDAFTGGAVLLIRVFQIWISPLDGPSCRFRPVCSVYGKIAVQRYGALLGGILAGDRILRCNIFSKPGHDPVPDLGRGD